RASTFVFVTQNWRGVYNDNEVGVWHDGGRWNIYNQTRRPMPRGASFFVLTLNPTPPDVPPPTPTQSLPTPTSPPPPTPTSPSLPEPRVTLPPILPTLIPLPTFRPIPAVPTPTPELRPAPLPAETPGVVRLPEESTVRVVLEGGPICPYVLGKAGLPGGRIVSGGRDYNSGGPFRGGDPVRVRGRVEVVIGAFGRVEAIIDFEVIGRDAHLQQRFVLPLRNLDPIPPGATLVPPTVSEFDASLRAAGAEFGACNDGEQHEIRITEGPVSRMVVIADTGGDDISDDENCGCDTKIVSLEFRPLRVRSAGIPAFPALPSLPRNAVLGWADLHAHPASHLAFGGAGLFHGNPGLALASSDPLRDLPACSPDKHAGFDEDPVRHGTRQAIIRGLESTRGFSHGSQGAPTFESWPHALSRTHQQMHITMIRRAYEGGMRLMIASVTDNQALANLWFVGTRTGMRGPDPNREFQSAVDQIRFIREMARANNDWMEVVLTPEQARNAIRAGKLALILGVEMDSLSLEQIRRLIREHGVRSVIPIHIPDNPNFGGAAVYDDLFNSLNDYLIGRFFRVVGDEQLNFRLHRPRRIGPVDPGTNFLQSFFGAYAPNDISDDEWRSLGYDRVRGGHRNALGLTAPQAIEALMAEGILLDVAHMSQQSTEDTLRLAERYGFPVINTHSGLRDQTRRPAPHEVVSERAMRFDHARRMARLGGVLGLGTAEATAEGWLASYAEATRVLGTPGRVAFGTDFNGLSPQIVASGGRATRYPLSYLSAVTPGARIDRPFVLGEKTFSFSRDGLAHYGMFPELLQRFWDLGPEGQAAVRSLFLSAEFTLQAWERAREAARRITVREVSERRFISLRPRGEICPSTATGGIIRRGGTDFGGAVNVSGEATVGLAEFSGRTQLLLTLVLNAEGPSARFTQRFVIELPTSEPIPRGARIVSPTTSRFSRRLGAAGFEIGVCNEGTEHTIEVPEGPIQRIGVIADTGAGDISTDTNCRCDMKITRIEFRPIEIEVPRR
ncbi:MAG: membrane dipeptidase, partial [Anaerolineae bacterium]|nr:membrane dipeptidase [Anaerolineae bacterium]